MKVVINNCYGGFSLSEEGILHYAKLKGITLYPEPMKDYPSMKLVTYWTCPPDQRPKILLGDDFYVASLEERKASNEAYRNAQLCSREIPRDDPALVQTVEELGDVANGRCADLKVVEIPDDVQWCIDEYDGLEHVAEVHRTWS